MTDRLTLAHICEEEAIACTRDAQHALKTGNRAAALAHMQEARFYRTKATRLRAGKTTDNEEGDN